MTLVVDVGTNAEIVLGDQRRLLAASSPTGPAFEGAQISRRPARGAGRDRARPDRPRDARAALPGHRRRRLVGRAGLRRRRRRDRRSPASAARGSSRSIAELFLAGVITADGVIDGVARGAHAAHRRRRPDVRYVLHDGDGRRAGPRIAITQNDVRAIQLAKAALYAGVRLLMDQLGIDDGRRDPPGRRVRQPDRPAPRDGPRARSPTATSPTSGRPATRPGPAR